MHRKVAQARAASASAKARTVAKAKQAVDEAEAVSKAEADLARMRTTQAELLAEAAARVKVALEKHTTAEADSYAAMVMHVRSRAKQIKIKRVWNGLSTEEFKVGANAFVCALPRANFTSYLQCSSPCAVDIFTGDIW